MRSTLALFLLVALTLVNSPNVHAQTRIVTSHESTTLISDENYYGAYLSLEDAKRRNEAVREEMNNRAFVSDYGFISDRIKNYPTVVSSPINLQGYQRLPALDEIIEQAKDAQIVILNESHQMAQHRSFGLLLAMALRDLGFDYLAMESFYTPDGAMVFSVDYPNLDIGHFLRDPIFADFVRAGQSLGYELVSYEQTMDQRSRPRGKDWVENIKTRESAQATNIIEAVLANDPDAKIFIYVGGSHGTENWEILEDGRDYAWMAARLKKATGIDPLTIEQVNGTSGVRSKTNTDVFNAVINDGPITQSVVLKNTHGQYLLGKTYHGKMDIGVFHPPQKMVDGRPDWLRMNGYRLPLKIKNSDYYQSDRPFLRAFVKGEDWAAIPVDQVLLGGAEGETTLLLPKGEYRFELQDKDGINTIVATAKYTDNGWIVERQ